MKKWLKTHLSLTDQGSKILLRSILSSFFAFVVTMLPVILSIFLLQQLLLKINMTTPFYIIASIVTIVTIFFVYGIEYNAIYNGTYKESKNIRIDIAQTLNHLPLSYFSKHDLSDLAQTIMADVEVIEHGLSNAIPKFFGFIPFLILISILLLLGNFKLGLITIIPPILAILLTIFSKNLQVKLQNRYHVEKRKNTESFQECIELQQEIKSFGLSDQIKQTIDKQLERSEKIHFSGELAVGMILSLINILLYLGLLGIILLGSYMLLIGEISIIYFIGYLLAGMKLKDAAESVNLNIAELFFIIASIQRVKEIRQTKLQSGKDKKLSNFDITLDHVQFSYDEDTPILKDVSFIAKQNEVTALVGKSGCGKTSILRLISKLYDYDHGDIQISGNSIKDISTKSLFEQISIVFQDVVLFNNSILENIRIGNQNATDEEVKYAAKLANCTEFIEKLPNKYDTLIGENGATLSGGERQRLSIARAFLKNAPIILLDEISASLDVDNEEKIQESLNTLIKNKTVIIISHRLRSIKNVDKIIVINDGLVEASGTHNELLKVSPTYQNLIQNSEMAETFRY